MFSGIFKVDDNHGRDKENTSSSGENKQYRKPNPLPRLQISVMLLLQVCEPMASQSIYPYINQVVQYIFTPLITISCNLAYQWAGYHWWGWAKGGILCWINCKQWISYVCALMHQYRSCDSRNHSSLQQKRSLSFNGVDYQTMSVENQCYWLAYWDRQCQCCASGFRALSGV